MNCETRPAPGESNFRSETEALITTDVRSSVKNTLLRIRSQGKNADVLLMGYPQLISGVCFDVLPNALTPSEIAWLNELALLLNTSLAGAVADANAEEEEDFATFTSPVEAFDRQGHLRQPGADPRDRAAADRGRPSQPASVQSAHPKPDGYLTYAGVATTALSTNDPTGPRAWGTAAAMALLALLTGGCGPDRGDMERRAVDEARTAAGDVQASLQDVVHTMAGASPAQLEEALEQSLEDSTVVTWHGAGVTTDGSTTWRVGVVEGLRGRGPVVRARLCAPVLRCGSQPRDRSDRGARRGLPDGRAQPGRRGGGRPGARRPRTAPVRSRPRRRPWTQLSRSRVCDEEEAPIA